MSPQRWRSQHGPDRHHSTGSRPGPGRAIGERADGGRARRPRRWRPGVAGAARRRDRRGQRHLHALRRAAGRGPGGRWRDPLPLAPRLFQPAHRRGPEGARVRRAGDLARGARRRPRLRARPGRQRRHAARRGERARGSAAHRDRRRRRRGIRGRRPLAWARLQRIADDAQRRRRDALRPAQPVQGLPRRHRAGGLDSVAGRRVLRRPQDRPAPRLRSDRDRHRRARRR